MAFTPSALRRWITVQLGPGVTFGVLARPATGEEARAFELAFQHAAEDPASAEDAYRGALHRPWLADRIEDWRDVLDADGQPIPWPSTAPEREELLDALLCPDDLRTTLAAVLLGAGEVAHAGK